MTFLPVVERELRVAARQRAVYWTRFGGAAAALVLGAWIMLIPHFRSPQRLGTALFHTVAVATFLYSCIAGLHRTADCLSEEKREGTLGLLFLTDLKGYDIVLGKLAATSVNAFYAMLAVFPVMAISLLAGGVGGTEFWRVVLVAVNNLFFSLAIGIFASAISRDERKAVSLAAGLMIFFAGGLPLIGGLIADANNRPPNPIFFVPSPGYAAFMSFDETYKGLTRFNYFYASVSCVHGLAWILLIASCYVVPRTWQDKVERRETRGFRAWLHELAYGAAATRARIRKGMLDINPLYWLAGRDRFKSISVWLFLGATGAFWLWGKIKYPRDWDDEVTFVMTALWLHTILKYWVATEACRRFTADRRNGALELLLSTPISVREILTGQLLALLRQFALPVMAVVLVDIVFLFSKSRDEDWVYIWVAGIVIFVADIITLSWVSMWTGLKSVNANRASGAAMARVLVLPWLLFAMLWTGIAILDEISPGPLPRWINDENVVVVTWIAIGLAVDLVFGMWAYRSLVNNFRETVAARFDSQRKGWLRRLFSSPPPIQASVQPLPGGIGPA
jgi:ABC-type transport system involved in multi-copper enzyme maturation permease subunit